MIISSIELNTAHPEVRRETTDLCLTHSRIQDRDRRFAVRRTGVSNARAILN